MPHPLQVNVYSPEELSVYSQNDDITEYRKSCQQVPEHENETLKSAEHYVGDYLQVALPSLIMTQVSSNWGFFGTLFNLTACQKFMSPVSLVFHTIATWGWSQQFQLSSQSFSGRSTRLI